MTRRSRTRPWLSRCCYHVSNTCYSVAAVFRFATMRQAAVKRLKDITDRYPIRLLDYLLHPDGYRLLIEAEHPGHLREALRSFHVGTTHDYCARRDWEGPVWRQRGAGVTLVQKQSWALRCALDMDFAMARTGNPAYYHPLLWKHSGHMELCDIRKRCRLLDRKAVGRSFMDVPWPAFKEWYMLASTAKFNAGQFAEEPWWHTALIVGSRQLCETVADTMPESWFQLKVYPALTSVEGLREDMAWTVATAKKRRRDCLASLVPEV